MEVRGAPLCVFGEPMLFLTFNWRKFTFYSVTSRAPMKFWIVNSWPIVMSSIHELVASYSDVTMAGSAHWFPRKLSFHNSVGVRKMFSIPWQDQKWVPGRRLLYPVMGHWHKTSTPNSKFKDLCVNLGQRQHLYFMSHWDCEIHVRDTKFHDIKTRCVNDSNALCSHDIEKPLFTTVSWLSS